MEYAILLVVVIALVSFSVIAEGRRRKRLETQQAAELESKLAVPRRAAEEDVTKFGEELQRLDSDVAGRRLDEAMQQDYTRALDAYDNAKDSLAAVTQPEEITYVTEILEDGRYAVACVKARVVGDPLPQKLPPCFFNPAHGPSVRNVKWTPTGGVERDVPACAADAERVEVGADPVIRTVAVGTRRVPYWEGGEAYAPWARGYFSSWQGSNLIRDVMVTSMIFHGIGMAPWMIGSVAQGVGEGLGELGEGLGDLGEGLGDFIGGLFGD